MNKQSPIIKTSISLPRVVVAWAKELAEEKGFANNFSSYMADLVRRDKEKWAQDKKFDQKSVRGRSGTLK